MNIKFILIFSLISITTYSQKNFKDGYIILKDTRDTIKGQIDDKNWLNNPNTISFKRNSEISNFNIQNLKAFGIIGKEFYEVETINLDVTPFQFQSLLDSPNRIIVKDTLIALMVLLKAEYQLSYFSDKIGKEHYFFKENGTSKELINHKFLQNTKSGTYEIQNKEYQKQLDSLFSKCPKTINTKSIKYSSKDLTDIFIDFNDCMGCSSVCYIKNESDKIKVSLHLVSSVAFSSLSQSIYEKDKFLLNEKSNNSFYSFGAASSITSGRSKGSNGFYTEILFSNKTIKNILYKADFGQLASTNLFRKNILTYPNFKPFIGLGFGINYNYARGIELTPLTSPNGNWNYLDYSKIDFDGVVETGFSFNRFFFFGRIKARWNNLPSVHTLILHQNTINFSKFQSQFGLSYQFIKNKKIE